MSQTPGRHAREWRRPGGRLSAPPFLLMLLILLGGCASGQSQKPPDLGEMLLKLDASDKMGGDPACRTRSVVATDVIGAIEVGSQGVPVRRTERWTVDRCGVLVPYIVKFARSGDGDLDVTMQVETQAPDTAPLPGASIADPVLQRDALGFLSLRDFSAAGVEGSCHSRTITNTELLQPLEGAATDGGRAVDGKWVERWTLDRCEKSIRYVMRFSTTPKGTTFTVEPEP